MAKLSFVVSLFLICFALPAQASPTQESTAKPSEAAKQDPYVATTTQTPEQMKPDTTDLKLRLRPLTKEQCEVEAKAWMQLLIAKNTEISKALLADHEADITPLREQQTKIVDRMRLAVKAFEARGGDPKPFADYQKASTKLDLDATDVGAVTKFATSWLKSPEGGIRVGINIIKFLLTLVVFSFLSRLAAGIVRRALGRMKNSSELLRDFFINATRRVVWFIGLIIALSMLEVDIGPFVAALGAAGFIIGFALQGTLSNFASGLMILMYRPYDVGEVVTVAGMTGKVDAMTLVSTTLRLPDNQTVVIPNNSIWGDVITNVTGQKTRRVDMVFGCGYSDDLQKTQALLEEIVKQHPKVHAEPAPNIRVHELADSSVNFIVRPWADTSDYWDVFWDVTRKVKERFDQEGLNIPFPQRDIHVHQVSE